MGIYLFRVQNSTVSTVSLLFGFLSSMRLQTELYTIQRDLIPSLHRHPKIDLVLTDVF